MTRILGVDTNFRLAHSTLEHLQWLQPLLQGSSKQARQCWGRRHRGVEQLAGIRRPASIPGARSDHRGYQGTRDLEKKKEKRLPWGEALEPARAGRAVLKFESGHGPEQKIALSILLEKTEGMLSISMLQWQQMKLVGTLCFDTDLHPCTSMYDGKLHYESEIFKKISCSVFKIFTIEQSYGNSWFKSADPEQGSRIFLDNMSLSWMYFEPESRNRDKKGPAFAEIFEKYCDANMAEERRV
jgi:hypothetical protein